MQFKYSFHWELIISVLLFIILFCITVCVSMCTWCMWYVGTGQECGVLSFPLKWVLGLNPGCQDCLPRVCSHWLSSCYPEKSVKYLNSFFFLFFFLITCFISEFPTWILLLAMEMLLKYCLHSFLWNKKNRVILFPVLNKLSSKWVSSHLNEILLLWEIVSRDSAEDYMDLEGNDSITFSDRESGDRTT